MSDEANGTAEATDSAEERRVRVVLVDDHRMFRTGVQAEIGRTEETGVEVVGEAADVDQAVTVITATRPEVVLLDVHLPGGGGVEPDGAGGERRQAEGAGPCAALCEGADGQGRDRVD